jgi:DNA modification methylase
MTGTVSPLPDPSGRRRRARKKTATSNFGSSRRESHDASAFYDRFAVPEISTDKTLGVRRHPVDQLHVGDATRMDQVDDATVALVVTSPPYFAGKEYEEALGQGHVPESYRTYLDMLTNVFAECVDKLEPGGRIAVNVANLGRRPYRSLSADVIDILQNRLRLLLRGEVLWWKGRAAGGSCAWGTFQRPGNPVLRDLTERIVIASKGRFDRAVTPRQRHAQDRPSTATMFRDEFLEATADLWEIAPESATRVGHPAPFPVELPQRLIDLYTYRDDLVLDPFMGSGTTAVAAVRTGRHYLGYDTDADYVAAARRRVADEVVRLAAEDERRRSPFRMVELTAVPAPADPAEDFQARAVREGRQAKELARMVLHHCGFTDLRENVRYPSLGVEVNFLGRDATGQDWAFDVSGGFTSSRAGLKRTDTLWKALGKAAVLHEARRGIPLVLLTTDQPAKGSAGHAALSVVLGPGKAIYDVVELLSAEGQRSLHTYATKGVPS